jgi:hypothetical protein
MAKMIVNANFLEDMNEAPGDRKMWWRAGEVARSAAVQRPGSGLCFAIEKVNGFFQAREGP